MDSTIQLGFSVKLAKNISLCQKFTARNIDEILQYLVVLFTEIYESITILKNSISIWLKEIEKRYTVGRKLVAAIAVQLGFETAVKLVSAVSPE